MARTSYTLPVFAVAAAKAALMHLIEELGLAESVYGVLPQKISQKAQDYIQKYANVSVKVGTVLFDRQGQIISKDAIGLQLIDFHISEKI